MKLSNTSNETDHPIVILPDNYIIQTRLGDTGTWLATDPAGRRVVVKPLPADCLHQGRLHPGVRDRLARVRELPAVGVAGLMGVERGAGGPAVTVWAYMSGAPIDDWVEAQHPEEAVLRRLMRQASSAVDSMHAHGLVHGNLHGGNLIVDEQQQVHLTDLSPYLHDDPKRDRLALARLATELGLQPQAGAGETNRAVKHGRRPRSVAIWLAVLTLLVGIAAAAIVLYWVKASAGDPFAG